VVSVTKGRDIYATSAYLDAMSTYFWLPHGVTCQLTRHGWTMDEKSSILAFSRLGGSHMATFNGSIDLYFF